MSVGMKWESVGMAIDTPCGLRREFNSKSQADTFKRLHKKVCEKCKCCKSEYVDNLDTKIKTNENNMNNTTGGKFGNKRKNINRKFGEKNKTLINKPKSKRTFTFDLDLFIDKLDRVIADKLGEDFDNQEYISYKVSNIIKSNSFLSQSKNPTINESMGKVRTLTDIKYFLMDSEFTCEILNACEINGINWVDNIGNPADYKNWCDTIDI